ncbi:2-amino-4-hydroxy-6-hydroxymethyldihydropteridine diphosphokinase [Serratia microhaemolytica]|uniref:2-amino-4-hydroxy-6- hydroxymethyldihydropteridine diphosphokinase n=1 Tax=Serratia microhaemolytica TaxID=2675110 RepID=UPI000FDD9611|nr:2-amino-4-hydroxy-6-hydroxymethyldihydropteridine diphosphokinase [Serratia microhaemolytica]
MIRVYIALGSNLADPVVQAERAIAALSTIPETKLVRCSPFYRSKPLGPQNQPDYLNAVVELETTLSALQLLDYTQAIELQQGRERNGERWGARTLDLDLLLYGDQQISNARLTVPHPGLKVREFVLYPLADIAPDLRLPDDELLSECLQRIARNGITAW